ncbi:MAG: IS1380 family transposase [Colwellia sp.]|nr:IS1380 family transposase [Colwellia sp.]
MKILKSNVISPFGGLNFVLNELDNQKIGELLIQQLPDLPGQCKYDWRDLLYSFWAIPFCGGDCLEDLSMNIRSGFESNPILQMPSPDRLLERMKELSVPKDIIYSTRGETGHEFSANDQLNRLNIKLLKRLGLLGNSVATLDFDHTMIFTDKADAKMTYKRHRGYNPGVGLIDGKVVYVENRNGNSGAHILQEHTLERMFNILKNECTHITAFRADSASFSFESLTVINRNVDKVYIRPRMSEALARAIGTIDDWTFVQTEKGLLQRAETFFTPFERTAKRNKQIDQLKQYRLVVTKEPRLDGQVNLFTGEAYCYWCVLTTDHQMNMNEIIQFYDNRGAAEKEFDILKNDFSWGNMPFSILEQNTVFLILSAMCRNIYAYMIRLFSKVSPRLQPQYRIKKFIFRFICIPAKWIRRSRSWQLRIYGEVAFKT